MRSGIPYLGGKSRLAKHIIARNLIPQHQTYVEPFAGMLGLLLARDVPSPVEAASDLPRAYNVLRQLQTNVEQVISYLPLEINRATYNATEIRKKADAYGSDIQKAADYLLTFFSGRYPVTASRYSAYRTEAVKDWNDPESIQRGFASRKAAWDALPNHLREVSRRLARVELGQRDAMDTLTIYDGPDTFHAIDPPYTNDERKRGERFYEGDRYLPEWHDDLLQRVIFLRGKVMLHGYESDSHRRWLKDWRRIQLNQLDKDGNDRPIYKSNGKSPERKPVEYVWLNYEVQ